MRALPGYPEPAVRSHGGGAHARREPPRVHHAARRGGHVAARGARAAARENAAGAAPVLRKCGWSVMEADTSELVTLAEKQPRKLGVAQACRIRQYGIEHWLQVAGRA